MKFIFDLDGTLTEYETLPSIADEFGVKEEIKALTEETIKGSIPFMESFIRRVNILGKLDPESISLFLENIPLNLDLHAFIKNNSQESIIATGNYRGWINRLVKRFDCEFYCSEGCWSNDQHANLADILRMMDSEIEASQYKPFHNQFKKVECTTFIQSWLKRQLKRSFLLLLNKRYPKKLRLKTYFYMTVLP